MNELESVDERKSFMAKELLNYKVIADFLRNHWEDWCAIYGDEEDAQEQIDMLDILSDKN